jgi:hypothetical protein
MRVRPSAAPRSWREKSGLALASIGDDWLRHFRGHHPKEANVITSAAASEPARRTKPGTTDSLHELLQRIEGEYRELPSLNVTEAQAQRLWGLDSTTCSFVLMILIQRGVLKRTASGTYIRR